MKKFDGMILPVLVCAEDGANGELAPAPSWSIESGAAAGFRIATGVRVGRQVAAIAGMRKRRRVAKMARRRDCDGNHDRLAARISTTAASARAICNHNAQRCFTRLPRMTR